MALGNQFKLENEEIDPLTGLPVNSVAATPTVDVNQYIKDKYGLTEKYSDESRAKLASESQLDLSDKFGAALASIGAGFSGRDAGSAGMAKINQAKGEKRQVLDDFDKGRNNSIQQMGLDRDNLRNEREDSKHDQDQEKLKREMDSNSPESRIAQDLAKAMGYQGDTSKLSAHQFKDFSPVMSKKYEIEQKKLDRQESRDERRFQAGIKMDEKQLVREEKKKTSLNEVEDRRRNIEDNLNLIEAQIREKGTYELFGSHNADLNRRVEMIATDMAKLADPNSVARPSEVEGFKKGLVSANMAGMKNDTALDLLKNFRSEVTSRADNAYKLRGIENPNHATNKSSAKFPMQVKLNGQVATVSNDAELKEANDEGWK